MKAIVLIFLSFLLNIGYSQEKIEIVICDNFKVKNNRAELFQLSLVQDNDTIPFPYLGKNMYLNILKKKKLEEISDNESVVILLENCKYIYQLDVLKKDLNYSFLEFCCEGKLITQRR